MFEPEASCCAVGQQDHRTDMNGVDAGRLPPTSHPLAVIHTKIRSQVPQHIEVSRGEKMALPENYPESYLTERSSVYEEIITAID